MKSFRILFGLIFGLRCFYSSLLLAINPGITQGVSAILSSAELAREICTMVSFGFLSVFTFKYRQYWSPKEKVITITFVFLLFAVCYFCFH